jgi:hypothetical protein
MAWWGDSAHNFNDCRILGPCPANPKISIAEAWDGTRVDIRETPMFPFGSRVKAHIPLALQNMGTGRCRDAIYIGRVVNHKGSITLRTLDTMKPVVRYSFKVLSQGEVDTSVKTTSLEIELGDDGELPELYYNHLTGLTSTTPVADALHQDGSRYRAAAKTQLSKQQQHYFENVENMSSMLPPV